MSIPRIGLALLFILPFSSSVVAADERAVNIVFILADDLGWGDLGCYGQQHIRTPNIDRLAREGMLFTRHYAGNAVCAPSRCVLMTGMHPGHAYVRNNRNFQPGKPGQIPLPPEAVTIPRLLQGAGYATGGFGKWGLGGVETTGAPHWQGMGRFFGYNCQGVAHNFYPTHLWNDHREVALRNPPFSAHQVLPEGLDPDDPASYGRYVGADYSADVIADAAVQFLRANRDRPFFLYFPSTIPHLALQAPGDALAEYADKFEETPYTGAQRYLPQRTPRACYAAMVSRLDRHVGRLLSELDSLGLTDRTIVVFTSDNGPAVSGLGGVDTEFFRSAGDLRGRKGALYEGGVRTPLLVRHPGRIPAGTRSDRVSGFEDWLPTLLDWIGRADLTPKGLDGISMAPTLRGQTQPERPFLYREINSDGGQQAVWSGRFKSVRRHLNKVPPGDRPKTELYDLVGDPRETTDVAAGHPQELARLEGLLEREHRPSKLFPLPTIDATVQSVPAVRGE